MWIFIRLILNDQARQSTGTYFKYKNVILSATPCEELHQNLYTSFCLQDDFRTNSEQRQILLSHGYTIDSIVKVVLTVSQLKKLLVTLVFCFCFLQTSDNEIFAIKSTYAYVKLSASNQAYRCLLQYCIFPNQ